MLFEPWILLTKQFQFHIINMLIVIYILVQGEMIYNQHIKTL